MKLSISHRLFGAILAISVSVFSGLSSANAAPLPPGGTNTLPGGDPNPAPLGALLSSSGLVPFQGPNYGPNAQNLSGPQFEGFLESRVYSGAGTGLLFAYQLTNSTDTAGSSGIPSAFIDSIDLRGFNNITIGNADFDLNNVINGLGDVGSDIADRPAAGGGSTVTFLYTGAGVGNDVGIIGNNFNSIGKWIFLETNATSFTFNQATIYGSGTATAAILAPVPEPATALAGFALLGVCLSSRFRKKA